MLGGLTAGKDFILSLINVISLSPLLGFQQYCNSRCSENYQVRPESLQTFQPSYASSKVKNKNDTIRNRISDFDKRRISQPKTQ